MLWTTPRFLSALKNVSTGQLPRVRVSGTFRRVEQGRRQAQVLQEFLAARHAVEAVEVQAGNAVFEQLAAEVGANLHSQLTHRFILAPEPVQPAAQTFGD